MSARLLAAGALILLLAACASVQPLQSSADTAKIDGDEKRVWAEAREADTVIRNSDEIYADAAATRYLQGVMDRLYPEFRGSITVHILKAPSLNAFALPNGSVYFHLGLLARLDNEAQLATVLGHEAAHFVHKHGYQEREHLKSMSAFAAVVPGIGDLIGSSSVYGYSRDLEREADELGFQRLVKAGYDPREAPKTFEILAADVKSEEIDEPYFFSTHPRLIERVETMQTLAAARPKGGRVGRPEFLAVTGRLRIAALESDLSMNHYKSVLLVLGDKNRVKEYPPEAQFYLGEAYRLRGDKGDETLMEKSYLAAVGRAPRFAPAQRALGVYYMKKKDYRHAEQYLAAYLRLAPNAPDSGYVRQYYNDMRKGSGK